MQSCNALILDYLLFVNTFFMCYYCFLSMNSDNYEK